MSSVAEIFEEFDADGVMPEAEMAREILRLRAEVARLTPPEGMVAVLLPESNVKSIAKKLVYDEVLTREPTHRTTLGDAPMARLILACRAALAGPHIEQETP